MVAVSAIRPAPENDKVYRPIDSDSDEIQGLASSIDIQGILEPLVITLDNVLISGHRRLAAAKRLGLRKVPCRRIAILHSDPLFLTLLRECNRQREKSLDEILREQLIDASTDGYADLLQYRERVTRVEIETGIINGHKHRASISKAKQPFLNAIEAIVQRLRDFWPLSVRLIHYQLLNDPPLIHASKPKSTYRNDQGSYKSLTDLLTRARIFGVIPFEAIHDPTRPVTIWHVFPSPEPYIKRELENFLMGYYRNLQVSQPLHVEIVGEKNTVGGIIRPVAMDYTIPFTLGRGYSSMPPRHQMAQRFRRSGKDKLMLIFVSDFDPEGEDIAHSFTRSMRDDFGIDSVEFVKAALTDDQVEQLQLQPMMLAKEGSSRRDAFVKKHGEHVYELEAAEPDQLQTFLRETIESALDMKLFRAEQDRERDDADRLSALRKRILDGLKAE
jgi:hypothetical protein